MMSTNLNDACPETEPHDIVNNTILGLEDALRTFLGSTVALELLIAATYGVDAAAVLAGIGKNAVTAIADTAELVWLPAAISTPA